MDANGLRRCEDSYCILCGIVESSSNDKQTLLKSCSRCKIAKYCCVEHQRSDFKVHKLYCKPITQAKAALVTIGNIDVTRNIDIVRRTNHEDRQIIAYMKAREKITDCMVGMAFHSLSVAVPHHNSKVRYIYEKVLDVLLDMFMTDQFHIGTSQRLVTILLLLGFDRYCKAFYHVVLDIEHCHKKDSNSIGIFDVWSKPDFLHQIYCFWIEGRAEPVANILSNINSFDAVVFLLIEQRMVKNGTTNNDTDTDTDTDTNHKTTNNRLQQLLSYPQVCALEGKLSPGLVSMMKEFCNQKPEAVDQQIADDLYEQSPSKTPIEYWLLLKKCSSTSPTYTGFPASTGIQ